MNYPLLIAAGLLLMGLGLINWRFGVFTALALVVVEGAIRKWVLPQASQLIYFGKDLVLLGAYARYFFWDEGFTGSRRGSGQVSEAVKALLAVSAAWIFAESFNPGTGSFIAGLFGWRSYVIYIPLCLMVPALFKTPQQLEQFLRYYLALALPVGLLGMAQFNAPPESPLNVYAAGVAGSAEASDVATFGEDNLVRVTGTFSYISGYSTYLVFVLALLLPVLAQVRSNYWRVILGGTMAVMVGNMGMTGSRSTVLGAGIVLIGFVVLTTVTGSEGERSRSLVHLLAGLAGVAVIKVFYQAAFLALQERVDYDWQENQTRLLAAIWEPWNFLGFAGVWGCGAGTTQPAVNALRAVLHLPAAAIEFSSPTDSENSRVLVELGLPGFLLWYSLRIALVVALWCTRRGLRSPFLRQVGLGAFLVLLFQLFAVTVFGPTSNCYHWFLAGFIGLLPKLDTQMQTQPATSHRRNERSRRWPRGRAAVSPAALGRAGV